jgi:hypothetical protein
VICCVKEGTLQGSGEEVAQGRSALNRGMRRGVEEEVAGQSAMVPNELRCEGK